MKYTLTSSLVLLGICWSPIVNSQGTSPIPRFELRTDCAYVEPNIYCPIVQRLAAPAAPRPSPTPFNPRPVPGVLSTEALKAIIASAQQGDGSLVAEDLIAEIAKIEKQQKATQIKNMTELFSKYPSTFGLPTKDNLTTFPIDSLDIQIEALENYRKQIAPE